MGRRKESTPRSRVTNALRQLWLRSRERAKVAKEHHNTCVHCGAKGSVAKGREVKIQVHHDPPIDWNGVVDMVFERLLNAPQYPLCKKCHAKEHIRLKETDCGNENQANRPPERR